MDGRVSLAASQVAADPTWALRPPRLFNYSPHRLTNMDSAALLAKLSSLSIQHENHAHEAVMTCEAQVVAL